MYDCYDKHTRMIFPEVQPSPRHSSKGREVTPEIKEMFLKRVGVDIEAFRGGVVVISHDRTFLKGLANKVLDLSGGGEATASQPLVYHGTYEAWVDRCGHEAPGVRR